MPWRRRRVVEEQAPPPIPRRPLIWPWLVLLLLLVAGAIAASYFLTREDDTSTVPSVVGQSVAEAVDELGTKGYTANVEARVGSNQPPGRVLSQAPSAGSELEEGNRVTIVVAQGPGRVEVPRVVGLPVEEAFVRLQAAELRGRAREVSSRQPEDRVIRQSPAPGSQATKGSAVLITISKGPRGVPVPAVRGQTEAVARSRLERLRFEVTVSRVQSRQPQGIVVAQEPPPRTRAPRGSVVALNVSTGPPTTTTTTTTTATTITSQQSTGRPIPQVVGLPQRDAFARLQAAGFRVDSSPAESSRPRGAVLTQRPAGGIRAGPDSLVRLTVSLGSGERPVRTIPDVSGMPEREAKQAIVDLGFTVRSVYQAPADETQRGVVISQTPAPGGRASAGSQITLSVGR